MEDMRRYELWLGFVMGVRPQRHKSLLEKHGSAEEVFKAARDGKLEQKIKGDDELFALMKEKANEWYIDRCLKYLKSNDIKAIVPEDKEYPELLREIHTPPMLLFVKGNLPEKLSLPIAVVGSRMCSDYGQSIAEKLSGELAECGCCIVSGMAYGIDKIAAEAALKAGKEECPTIAVLGCGVDVVYPHANKDLYDEICERGAVISEFLPGTKPEAFNFPMRNRIISGISKGVLVVEAAMKSGTRITVDHALDQGRDVFAVPGRITEFNCEGTNQMIREGMAKAVFCVEDILEEYGVDAALIRRADKIIDESTLSMEELLILRLLRAGERSVDELCEMTGMNVAQLNFTLTSMEFSGIIKQSSGRMYGL